MPELTKYHQLGHVLAHYSRDAKYYSNTDVDTSKSYLNKNYAPDHGCTQAKYINKYVKQVAKYRKDNNMTKIRKDAVKFCTWCVTAPKDLDEEHYDKFFQLCYEFTAQRYGERTGLGEACMVSAWRHSDEGPKTRDHIHLCFVSAIFKDGKKRLCGKELIDRKELKNYQVELEKYVNANGCRCHILNGNTTINPRTGKAYKPKDYKRDLERTIDRDRERTRGRF